ncbi:MAG: hypothetical protein U0361_13180 [Nitrospiraceae bacterium]
MSDGSEKDLLMLGGTIAGFLAAILSILEKVLDLHKRLVPDKDRKQAAVEERTVSASPRSTDLFDTKVFQKTSYLLLYETGVIVAAGLLLNYLGLTLSRHLQSILFLDMTGTALAAFLLGPWWGAIVALLSNSVVNWLLYPETGADVVIFPWSLVNITGGFFWGLMARRSGFRKYLRSGRNSLFTHAWFLFSFGVLGAVVMSVPGTVVQAALGEKSVLALNPEVAATLRMTVGQWEDAVRLYLESIVGLTWSENLGWSLVNWFQNCIRYIPDKTFSAAIALVVLKYAYPLFERELIHGGPDGEFPRDERVVPLVLGLLYAPSFGTLVFSEQYAGSSHTGRCGPLRGSRLSGLFRPASMGSRRVRPPGTPLPIAPRVMPRALKIAGGNRRTSFTPPELTFVTLIASLIFALSYPSSWQTSTGSPSISSASSAWVPALSRAPRAHRDPSKPLRRQGGRLAEQAARVSRGS